MALIKCPECGQMVSDKAKACIHCGAPLIAEEAGPLRISFPAVSSLFAKGIVHCNGKEYTCKKGETLSINITESTTIDVKLTSFFGNPSLAVDPGDKVVVRVNQLGAISLAKVDSITGENSSSRW